jgi:Ion channel
MTLRHLLERNNAFWNEDRSLSALLFYLSINTFLIVPFAHFRAGELSFAVVYSLILLSGVFAIGDNLKAKIAIFILAVLSFLAQWSIRFQDALFLHLADDVLAGLFFLALIIIVLRHIFREGDVTFHRIQGAIAVYLLIGLVFSRAYHFIYLIDAQAFQMTDLQLDAETYYSRFVYFSFVTLTTLGFGDITAVNLGAKSLVMIEGLFGQLFPAIMITRLVTLEIEHRKNRKG